MPEKHLELAIKSLSVEPLTPASTVAIANIARALNLITAAASENKAPIAVKVKRPKTARRGRPPRKSVADQPIIQKVDAVAPQIEVAETSKKSAPKKSKRAKRTSAKAAADAAA